MPPQKRVKGHDRVDLRRMQVQVSGHILDRFRLDVAVLLLSQQQHWNQCRSLSGVERELSGIRFLRATGVREDQRDGAESSDKNEENQNWHPAFEHASGLPKRANSVDYARNDSNL